MRRDSIYSCGKRKLICKGKRKERGMDGSCWQGVQVIGRCTRKSGRKYKGWYGM